jgi:hypothetical protein
MGQGDPGGKHQGGIRAAGRNAPPGCATGFPDRCCTAPFFLARVRVGSISAAGFVGVGDGVPPQPDRPPECLLRTRQ